MQNQADKTGTSHPRPKKKNRAQSKMTDLKPTIPMLVSSVNIPKGHSKRGSGHTKSLRHVSLGFWL